MKHIWERTKYILEMKNIIVEIKISVDGFNGKVNTTER